jgi:hypothetical protein
LVLEMITAAFGPCLSFYLREAKGGVRKITINRCKVILWMNVC